MAAKVNVKFVVMLGAALTLVLVGMAAVFFFVLKKSGEDWARRGEEAMAAGDYEEADQAYSFAVAHDRTNVEWLKGWLVAMEHHVIDNEIDFEDRYARDYRSVKRMAAHSSRSADLPAHLDYLELVSDSVVGSTRSDSWRFLLSEARASQAFFEGGAAPVPGQTEPEAWHALYKYSGFALSALFTLNLHQNEDEARTCERDLLLALGANASDSQAALELSQYYAVLGDRRRTTPPVDLAAGERHLAESRRVLADLMEREPRDATAAIGLLQLDVNRAMRDLAARTGGNRPTPAQFEASVAPFRGRLDAVAALLMEQTASGLDRVTMMRFNQLELRCAPGDGLRRTMELTEASLRARPDDVDALTMLGELLGQVGRHTEAVQTFQRLVDLPNKPLGPEGFRLLQLRPYARQKQAEFTLERFSTATDDGERRALLGDAARYREALAASVPADSPSLLKIDARMAFLRGEWASAERLLLTVNERVGGNDREVLWWLAQTEINLQKLGEARKFLMALEEQQRDMPNVLQLLAAVERDLRNDERAKSLARRLLEIVPDNPEIVAFAQLILGSQDPLTQATDRFRATAEGAGGGLPDPDAAIAGLVEDFQRLDRDPRLGMLLVRIYLDRSDVPGAMGVIDQLVEDQPEQADFLRIRAGLEQGEIVPVLLTLIDSSEATPLQRHMSRRMVLLAHGRAEEASAELAAATAIEPDNPGVIEARFLDAIGRADVEGARRVAARARELNIDGLNGDTFQFRVLIAEGKHREAVVLLENLVARSPNDASLWRFLALERYQTGRMDDAVRAFRRTLEIRPNDVQTALELMDLLSIRGRDDQALAVARDTERFARTNLDFLNRLWTLESRAGNGAVALAGREALRARDKALIWNNAPLAEIYMDRARWEDARSLINEMRTTNDSLGLAALDARWHADRGDIDAARRVYTDYIGRRPSGEVGAAPYLALAQFMLGREQFSLAAAALESGRVHQDPATMECDRALGDVLTAAQRLTEAAEAFSRVVEGGADDATSTYRMKLAEALISLGQFDEAAGHLNAMSRARGDSPDRTVLLLRAELERRRGNRVEANRLLDDAVRRFPEDAVVYYQRAELLQEDESRLMDALADFDSAVRKAPSFWQALRNRSGVYRRLNRMNEAVADLRAATVAAGTDGEAVTQLLSELINLRRTPEAVSAAEEAVAARPTDLVFVQRVGGVFAARGEWQAAARFFKQAFDLRAEVAVAQRYLDCLLNQRPPQLRLAEDVINVMGQDVLTSPVLLAAKVTIDVQRNRIQDAERDASLAFDLVSTSPRGLLAWHLTISRAFGDRAAYQSYLRRLAAAKQNTALKDWPVLFLAISQAGDRTTSAAAIEQLNRLANQGQPVEVRLNAMRTIGTTLYENGDYTQAADIWMTSLQAFPDDGELNNNLAYVLTEYLGRAEEAIPYALKAWEAQPRSPSVNDTVGWAYFKTGDYENALRYLGQARRLSRDAAEQATTVGHLIEVEVARGEKVNAQAALTYLRRLITESPWLDASVRTRADELEAKINSLP